MDRNIYDDFAQAVDELQLWVSLQPALRGDAKSWWWGSLKPLIDDPTVMPANVSAKLSLGPGATYREGAAAALELWREHSAAPPAWTDR
jgi:hypothetical protein